MSGTICGIHCEECGLNAQCKGCAALKEGCMIARCCQQRGNMSCAECGGVCELKARLIEEFNALGIEDMETVTDLNALKGSFVNLEYTLPGGQRIRIWDDERIYLGNQMHKKGSERCYGLTADERMLLVCEYGDGGTDAEIVVYKRRHDG
ncbi:MAG: DUF3795 domain-containing protein [Eubacteriales bacterium]|nr:DUF3795 domain-containing protein [Eubacteriales bacterium]